MSAEWLTALSTFATFLVIAGTAVAAVVQLHHMHNTNQLTVLNEVRREMRSPEFVKALEFIRYEFPRRAQEPAFREALLHSQADRPSIEWRQIRDVANFFDTVAAQVVKHGMVDRDLACDWWYTQVVTTWDTLTPLIASLRRQRGYRLWEDFEYLALLCKRFRLRHPRGTYPAHEEALPLPEPWPETSDAPR
jgi:hypothetical protein